MRNVPLTAWLLGWPLVAHHIFQGVSGEVASAAVWVYLAWYLIPAVLLWEGKDK